MSLKEQDEQDEGDIWDNVYKEQYVRFQKKRKDNKLIEIVCIN